MRERQIRVTTALSAALWVVGVGLIVLGVVTDRNGLPGLGVMSGLAATVLYIRGLFAEHNRCIRQAFEMGCEHERGDLAELHSLP